MNRYITFLATTSVVALLTFGAEANAQDASVTGITTVAVEGAASSTIKNLPSQGLVKLTGTAENVGKDTFRLKDATGSIRVNIESVQADALQNGAEVSVTGYIDKGLLGKDITATSIQVMADATPLAEKTP